MAIVKCGYGKFEKWPSKAPKRPKRPEFDLDLYDQDRGGQSSNFVRGVNGYLTLWMSHCQSLRAKPWSCIKGAKIGGHSEGQLHVQHGQVHKVWHCC